MLTIGAIKTTLIKVFVSSSFVLFTSFITSDALARIHFHVEPNYTYVAPTQINQLAVGGRLTIVNSNTNVTHNDDTQDNIHHLLRCGPQGLSFSGGYVNIGSTDYVLELYLDGQRKFHCNDNDTHPNYYGPFYDRNTTKNTNVRLDLVRRSANANETSITLPDHMTFCSANAEDGMNSRDCRYFYTDNDFRYYFRTTSGSRTITVDVEKDYGDAGGTYRTLASENGANHEPSTNLYLGFTQADAEAGTADNTSATADDTSGTDDEDTPAIANFFATSSSLSFDHPVVNTTGTNAYVYAWVDWDNNGRFDRDEFVSGGTATGNAIQINNNATSVNLSWFDLPTLSDNQTFITRIRISPSLLTDSATGTNEDPRSYGNAGIGEVEDHQISVTAAGVLPDIVTCAVADQAYPGRLIPDLPGYNAYAGMSIVGDELYSSAATSGGLVITKRFDVQILRPNQVFNYPLNIEAEFRLKNLLDADGDTLFWLTDHINMNGVLLADRFNAVAGWVGATAEWNGTNPLAANYSQSGWTAFANNDGTVVTTYNRYKMRMTIEADNSTKLQVTIYDDNGNELQQSPVVDGRLAINPNNGIWLAHTTHFNDPSTQSYIFGGASILVSDNNGCDYGDAPDTVAGSSTDNYETLAINSGPSHTIVNDMYLGTNAADPDSNGFHDGTDNNNNASDDDVKGTTPDDEDAISAPISILSEDFNLNVVCNDYSATNGNLGGVVYGWIDANRNGLFETSESASAQCNDTSATANGSASLSWSGLDLVGGISYLRLRITNSNLVDTSTVDTKDDRAYGSTNRGEIEDHQIAIASKVSGYVFHDNGDSSGIKGNGIKDGGEPGLADVAVTIYNSTDNQCTVIDSADGSTDANGDGVINSLDTGYYEFSADPAKSYTIYETAGIATPVDCSTGPPSSGTFDKITATVTGNQIKDLDGYMSTTSNVIDIGQITSDVVNQNFADISHAGTFPTCDANAYVAKNSPSRQFNKLDLATGEQTNLSVPSILYTAMGYSVRQNLIFGVNYFENDFEVVAVDSAGNTVASFRLTDPALFQSRAVAGDVTDDDKLIFTLWRDNRRRVYIVDVDPTSVTYMQVLHTSALLPEYLHDLAIHPDGTIWTLVSGAPFNLARLDINMSTGATTVVDFGTTNLNVDGNASSVIQSLYFDDKGYLYTHFQNPDDAETFLYRFDLSNSSSPHLVAAQAVQTDSANGADGARCRYAPVNIDFGDAPNSYLSSIYQQGPRHKTDAGTPYIGTNGPDNESESIFDSTATGDDTSGLTPDDEDGFIQPSITTILAESDIFTVVVPVNSSGNDNLYGWIDFDGDGSFDDTDEKASAAVSATGNTNLNFTVPADIQIAESMIRLRVCSSTANCDTPITVAKDGEVEDHVIELRPVGDLELELTMEPSVNVTLGIPFNIVVAVTNNGTTIAANTQLNLPIPTGYSFVKAYAGDGTTEIDTYDSATGVLDLGNVGLGFSDYAIIRLAPQVLTAGAISAEISATDISDTDSTPNNGFDNGEDDTDTVTPVISNTISPGICEAPSAYTRGDAFVSTNNEYIVTPNQPQQAGYLWSYDFIDLNKPMYAELAVYLGDRDCNVNCAGFGRESGADGMTFVLSADPDGINAGEGNGGGLGVFGVNPSIVVEFDTFDNSYSGVSVDLIDGQNYIDHTGIYRNGNVTNPPAGGTIMPAVAALNGELEDGRYHIAQFEWDPATNLFKYYLDGILIGEVTRDIRADLGTSVVRFGFTGSTGPAYNLQKACFTDAPNVLGSDFGDAPDTSANTATGDYQTTLLNNGALHVQADSDDNGLIDLRLGSSWDADSGDLQNGLASADDEFNLDDEDGVTLPPALSTTSNFDMVVQVSEDTNRTSSGMHIYAWADWNNNGEWEASERFVSETNASNGTNSFTDIAIPANAVVGQIYVRVRLCSNTDCSTPLGVAMDGEVEDYRVLLSDLSPNNQCNMILQTRLPVGGTSYSYNKANVTVEPLTFTDIVNPIYIEDETDFANINSLGFDRNSGLVYGTYTDLNSTNKQQHLFVTDKEGTSFIDLGLIRSKNTQSMRRMDNGATFSFQKGDALRHNGYDSTTRVLGSATMGDVTDDGTTYIVWRTNWDSMLRIDLATQEFTVVPVDVAEMGASVGGGSSIQVSPDFAISAQNGLAYTVDYINDNLYAIDTATGTVTQSDLIYLGAKPTPDANGKLQAGGMIIDDAISLYTITNGGNHDSDHNGTLDVVGRSVVYRVNVATSEVEYLVATNETSLQGNDAAGCFEAVDYGDALSTYGTVSHAYLDVALDGKADLTLGDSWDPEFNSWFSLDAKGDDSHGRDDETLNLPTTIIVDNSTNLPIEVTGSGFINIWADLNNDGDFADSNEHIVSDQAVSNGNNDISVNLNSSAAQGFSGDTVMRIRLCSALSSCNTPSGSAADGEVEDHLFELINHILLSGIVFDDNGLGNATLAHNGIQDGNEIGIGDVMLTLTLNDVAVNGFNTGDIIKSVTTAGNGAYQFNLDIDFSDKNIILSTVEQATWIDISEANVTSIPQVTSASVTDGTMSVTASAGNNLTGLNFGKVASPTFDTDNFTEIEPGTFVLFRHKFTALTSGVVVFNIDLNNGLPNNWTVNLFEDINCNGQIDGMDAPLTPINVDINTRSEVCLTAKVVVPADAKINQTLSYDIVADMTFADDANTNHGITRTPTNTDSTRATYDGAGTLALNKTVRNITQGGGVTTTNFAKPGDILEYVISFTNSGSGDISNVVLFDTIPPFTKLNTAVTCGSAIPTNNSCTVESPSTNNSAGYQGDIRWKLNSTLAAGESGTVSYQVKVD